MDCLVGPSWEVRGRGKKPPLSPGGAGLKGDVQKKILSSSPIPKNSVGGRKTGGVSHRFGAGFFGPAAKPKKKKIGGEKTGNTSWGRGPHKNYGNGFLAGSQVHRMVGTQTSVKLLVADVR